MIPKWLRGFLFPEEDSREVHQPKGARSDCQAPSEQRTPCSRCAKGCVAWRDRP